MNESDELKLPAGTPRDVSVKVLKAPTTRAERRPSLEVVERVSEMLSDIRRKGMDAVRRYSSDLDNWNPEDFLVSEQDIAKATDSLSEELLTAIEFAQTQVKGFATKQRSTLVDFEIETLPGVFLGQKQIPVGSVGAYVPAGRLPMLACPLMTVLVAKVAGVERIVACSPPQRNGQGIYPTILHSIATSGAKEIYALGGVQALAAMAFGLIGTQPVDIITGPGNAYVAEAKRQLFGDVGIDLLAGPSEVTVMADETADPELVASDLLGQAEHGKASPSVLVTTSEAFGRRVLREIDQQLEELIPLSVDDTLAIAWRDFGAVLCVESNEAAVKVLDGLAPEHLEVQTANDDWFFRNLTNYGSLFVGTRATVAFSDKAIGTNHTLPTQGAARYTGGLSVAKFTKTVTYQRIDTDEGVAAIAPAVAEISAADLMPAHRATATRRLKKLDLDDIPSTLMWPPLSV